MSADEVIHTVLKDIAYYNESGGGVTFSGGEPLLQADFLLATSELLKEQGISVAIDTSGFIWNDKAKEAVKMKK